MIGLEKATGLDSIITLICYLAFATKTHSLIEEKKFQNVFFLAKEYFSVKLGLVSGLLIQAIGRSLFEEWLEAGKL